MTVYVDFVFLINFIFDLILLMSVNYILRRNVSMKRMIIGSLVGEITLVLMFIKICNILFLLIKLLMSFIIVIVTFGYKDIKYTSKNITYFYLVSMLLGGGIEFLDNQFSYTNEGLVFVDNGLSIIGYGIILLVSLIIYYFYLRSFKELKNNYSNYYLCKIFFDSKQFIEVNAFLDTGNKLKDPYSDKSIILVDKDKMNKICVSKPLFVPYNSLNNHGLLTCYKGFKIEIDGKSYDRFLIGISDEHFYMDGIDCIINNFIMEGLK